MATSNQTASRFGAGGPGNTLGPRALNRALLERQMLLSRSRLSVLEALEQLIGLQAQAPHAPEQLSLLMVDRSAVRIALMRSTLFLIAASDFPYMRALCQPVLEHSLRGTYGRSLTGLERDAIAAAGRAAVEEEPRTFSELGRLLLRQWSDRDPAGLAAAVRTFVPLVQVPPRGIWGRSGQAKHTSAESWLGMSVSADPSPDRIVRRYLNAFGPASVKDMQIWSGLTRLSEVVDRLRPELRTFRDEQGNELFDLPDAPLPDPNSFTPVRYLGEFDNVLLSHADRTRIMKEGYRRRLFTDNGIIRAAVLVDGFVRGKWSIEQSRGSAVLHIEHFEALSPNDMAALTEEGARLLAFAAAKADVRDIRFVHTP